MSDLGYLDNGLLQDGNLREDLAESVRTLARDWVATGVDPGSVELLAELLARWAAELDGGVASADALLEATGFLRPAHAVVELVSTVARVPLDRIHLAALAVHLLDIAEAMALRVFVPELPALSARSDRTGDAARMVGTARHLKG